VYIHSTTVHSTDSSVLYMKIKDISLVVQEGQYVTQCNFHKNFASFIPRFKSNKLWIEGMSDLIIQF
jgi:hypothetical protein